MNQRLQQYRGKINFICEKIESLPNNEINTDILRDAVFYKIQVIIESSSDIVAMLVKDIGKDVEDDYTNIETLKKEGIISQLISEKLKEWNGLRNVLVHRYNKIEEDVVLNNLEDIKKTIMEFIENAENAVGKIKNTLK